MTTSALLIIVGLIALVLGAALASAFFREPSYAGRRLSDWLRDYRAPDIPLYGVAEQRQQKVEMAVRAIGTNAVPSLLRWARTKDCSFSDRVSTLLNKCGGIFRVHFADTAQRHNMAFEGFRILGRQGRGATSDLAALATNGDNGLQLLGLRCLVATDPDENVLLSVLTNCISASKNKEARSFATLLLNLRFPEYTKSIKGFSSMLNQALEASRAELPSSAR